jgi:hypothetical protein
VRISARYSRPQSLLQPLPLLLTLQKLLLQPLYLQLPLLHLPHLPLLHNRWTFQK